MRLLRTTALLVLVLVASSPLVLGQTATGEVNGTITDPNGAVMTGATAKLINQATNIEVRTQPNQNGFFTFVILTRDQKGVHCDVSVKRRHKHHSSGGG